MQSNLDFCISFAIPSYDQNAMAKQMWFLKGICKFIFLYRLDLFGILKILIYIPMLGFGVHADGKICLNMIVKNESEVIKDCLETVKPIIDYWVIVDTGSTDGTQRIIREFMQDIPGELHERPWVNFAHNRNEAMALAKNKGDYLLFIDADEKLEFSKSVTKLNLSKDCYCISVRGNDEGQPFVFQRAGLINNHLDWSWQGILHETIYSSQAKTFEVLEEMMIAADSERGARTRDPQKYHKDAQLLEQALEKEPNNSRYVFYLASTYENAKEYPLAIKNYEKRAQMGGWDQEVFYSLLSSSKLKERLEKGSEVIVESYSKAYKHRPSRAEPLYYLTRHYIKTKNYALGYIISKFALGIPLPDDLIPIETWIYDYALLFEFARCAYEMGAYVEAGKAYEQLLQRGDLPVDVCDSARLGLQSTKLKLLTRLNK